MRQNRLATKICRVETDVRGATLRDVRELRLTNEAPVEEPIALCKEQSR
jgi:hypothetical protein